MENKEQIILNELSNKSSAFYFYVPPTNGVPSGAIAYIYDMVDILRESGLNGFILHDKDYKVPMWMGGNYHNLPHIAFEQLKIKASDFLFIPEVYVQPFFSDMKQNNIQLPCEVVVLSQISDMILHSLDMGAQWYHWGVRNVVTTTNTQKDYINRLMNGLAVEVVNPYIHDDFKKSDKPQKPVIIINTRDKARGEKLANEFSRLHPHYTWIPSKFLANMDRADYATHIRECCLAVWVDEISSFGTFPLECMKSGVPVVGKIPEMIPEWMGEEKEGVYNIKDNGVWLLSTNQKISDFISSFLDQWFTDSLEDTAYVNMDETVAVYSKDNTKQQIMTTVDNLISSRVERVKGIFEKQSADNNKKITDK